MIEARGLGVDAGARRLIDDVSLAIAPGELVAVVGPNGAGKSTLLAALCGDRAPSRGRVALAGVAVAGADAPTLARLRAVLPQRPALTAGFTALEVVWLGDPAASAVEARARLAAVDAAHLADRRYPSLSGGEQQRVQLARVLAQLGDRGGRALFLDEPTAALDPRFQHQVLGLARAAARAGHAVVAVLHDLTLAARYADRVAVMCAGRLLALDVPHHALHPARLEQVFAVSFDLTAVGGRPLLAARPGPTSGAASCLDPSSSCSCSPPPAAATSSPASTAAPPMAPSPSTPPAAIR